MGIELDIALGYLKKLAKEVEDGNDEAIIEMIDIIYNIDIPERLDMGEA
tara:strand:- start:3003 stop:3149 length:147 start_codon:yes stop_codon:yes gene_type:complete